jgi:signal transduction histidine kinase
VPNIGPGIKFRLLVFAVAITFLAFVVGALAHYSWTHVEQLSEGLTRVQNESFRDAQGFRANLQAVDAHLRRFEHHPSAEERDRFLEDWKRMTKWLEDQKPRLTTGEEEQIVKNVATAYEDYFTAATQMLGDTGSSESRAKAIQRVEEESERLLGLGYHLVDAHRESVTQFMVKSRRILGYLRAFVAGALVVLLGLCIRMGMVVYGEMIAPLQVKLVESRTIIERQEKLASLGMLAAGVAHEIRNPLTAIKARLFTQQRQLKAGSPELEAAQFIGQEIVRLERIVKDFLEFARPSEPKFMEVEAGQPLREAQVLLGPQLQKRQIELRIEDTVPIRVRVDPEQIKQVLINLIQNAADSIHENGFIVMRAKRSPDGKPSVILEVSDTGPGIPPDVEKRLFDPFFTTKENGTGLGLSIAARIVEKHGGALQYQTRPNRGTTFGIVLPAIQDV